MPEATKPRFLLSACGRKLSFQPECAGNLEIEGTQGQFGRIAPLAVAHFRAKLERIRLQQAEPGNYGVPGWSCI